MKKTTKLTSALLSLCMAIVLLGCSVASATEGTVELEFWSVFTGADAENMNTIVDSYNASQSAYKIVHRAMSGDDLYLKLPLAVQSGQDVPDFATYHCGNTVVAAMNGQLSDMQAYLAQAGIQSDDYNSVLYNAVNLNSAQYGVPLSSTCYIMYVNMDLYEKYGDGALEDGKVTWDEIMEAGERLKADGLYASGAFMYARHILSNYAVLNGSFSSDGKTPDFDADPKMLQSINIIKEMNENGYLPPDGDPGRDLFYAGQVLYLPDGGWALNGMKQSGINFQMVNPPVFETSQSGHWADSHNFVLPRQASFDDHRVAGVMDFIQYFGENSFIWAQGGHVPAAKAVLSNQSYLDLPVAFLSQGEADTFRLFTYEFASLAQNAVTKVADDMVFGRTSVEEGLNAALRETKDLIEQN